ncbi:hypothetical protein FPQ18DRAFT_291438 [Pyronema domesticum]|nr:hypothetical protein FPQ18DRAFT_291438 [Pyronema domesticum]
MPRKRDRLCGQFKSLKGFSQPWKKTKENNTGNLQTNHTTATSFSTPVPTPSDPTPTPSTIVATTTEFSLEAQSRGAIRIESFQSDSASQSGQTPVTATVKHTAHAKVGNKDEQQHNSTVTGIVKAQSLWSKALGSDDLNQERETLEGITFQANALHTVSEARSFAEKILNDKKENALNIKIKGEKIVLRDIAMKLLGWMDRFKEIGDIIVQFDPVHAALPWAGFRFLLKVCMDNQKTMDAIFMGLEKIAGLIHRCTLYELLYLSKDSCGSKNLEKSMLRLYIAILKFLAKAIGKLKQNRLKAVFTTEDISDYLGNVENFEKTVGYDADAAKAQSTGIQLEHLRTQLENINNTMLHIQPQLHNIQDWLEDSERSSILEWISTIPYPSHHKRISAGRLEGTGKWLFERQEYRMWISSSVSKLLLLRGTPGAGKTYIASTFIDSLHSNTTAMKLAYFYCNRAEENRREPDSILSTIIQQLAQSPFDKNKLLKPIVDIYRDRKNQGQISSRLSLSESQELLVQLTDIYPRTMICIYALDEVAEDKRIYLLKALNYVISQSKNLVKIFAMTRMNPEIVAQFKMFPRIELQPDDNVSDINRFVKTRVKSTIDDSQLLSGDVSDELQVEICKVLCKRSKGMFQLAALQITFLCQFCTEGNVRDNLQTLPDTLAAAYDDIYNHIIAQKGDAPQLALNAFRWIQCSYEPLRAETLLDTITVEVGRSGELSRKAPIKAKDLLTICQNLLLLDERLNVFRFAHLSVEEYLETKPELSKASSHTEIAKGCLSLLCTPSSWDDYNNVTTRQGQYGDRHLLLYSVVFWPWHFSHCKDVKKKKKKKMAAKP